MGCSYDSSWRYKAGISSKDGAFGKSVNDDTDDWQAAYALFPGRIAYVWMSSLALPVAAQRTRRLRLRPTLTHHLGQGAHRDRPRSLPLEARDVLVRRQEGRAGPLGG